MTGLQLYRWMVMSRELESSLCKENPRWFPAEAEEAAIVGAFSSLETGDVASPHYRGPFVVYLMRGAELRRLVCQALGRLGGYNKSRSVPFTGPSSLKNVPWVAGDLGTTIGTATGAALALQQEGSGQACVCSFGDGTSNRGDFHENLNLAAVLKLPIVYVCQNNYWAISQHANSYLAAPIVDRAAAYGMPGKCVDGNDVEAVETAVAEAVMRARQGHGPSLIEARTWRKRGHWAGDKASYRGSPSAEECHEDPLELHASRLVERGDASQGELEEVRQRCAEAVSAAVAYAKKQPVGGPDDLGEDAVYA